MDDSPKKHRNIRHPADLLDKAKEALAKLYTAKVAEQASGRFGVVLTFDAGKPTGVRQIADEPVM